jgi:hypothetical protein
MPLLPSFTLGTTLDFSTHDLSTSFPGISTTSRPEYSRMQRTVVTINSNGRQSASFIRVAAALGWQVRAQMRDVVGIVAEEISKLTNVTAYIGKLEDKRFLDNLFKGAQLAFINTTHWGDEVAVGKSIADAAKKAGIQHLIYSSMPDHSVYGQDWRSLPMWSPKFTVGECSK